MSDIRPATLEDIVHIAKNLRSDDVLEVITATQSEPGEAILRAVTLSRESYTARLAPGEPPCLIFGVTNGASPGVGVVWLLATDAVLQGRLAVFRGAREWIQRWSRDYHLLHNVADIRNTLHLRWIKSLGFSFGARVPLNGFEFQHFYLRTREEPRACAS